MIQVKFFAQVRELVGTGTLSLAPEFADAEALRAALAARGDKWALALAPEGVLVAVNQTLVARDTRLRDGDEVAFFPPVTGG